MREGLAGLPGLLFTHLLCIRDLITDLRRGLEGVKTPPGSIVLAHMVTAKHLTGPARVLRKRPNQAIILMRYQAALVDNPGGGMGCVSSRPWRRPVRLSGLPPTAPGWPRSSWP